MKQISETVVEQALDAFWERVASCYPEVQSGDFPPGADAGLRNQARAAVALWLSLNHPDNWQQRSAAEDARQVRCDWASQPDDELKRTAGCTHAPEAIGECDAWICKCGNSADDSGFQTCDMGGRDVEPTEAEWTSGRVRCVRCGAIIEQETGLRVEPVGDGDPDFPGGIGCEYCDSLWATAESVSQHVAEAHRYEIAALRFQELQAAIANDLDFRGRRERLVQALTDAGIEAMQFQPTAGSFQVVPLGSKTPDNYPRPSECIGEPGLHCANLLHEHSTDQPADEQARSIAGEMLCNHCDKPIFFDSETGDYWHTNPETPACFLIPLSRKA